MLPGPVVTVRRASGWTTNVFTTGAPVVRRNVAVTVAAATSGLARSTKVWKPALPPTRPSASPQRRPVAVTPKALCASCHRLGSNGQYIARSTTMPTSEVIRVATLVARSDGSSSATLIVSRAAGRDRLLASSRCRPPSRR